MAPAVVSESLTKRFGALIVAVDDLSFSLEPGTITGFLGPNGAGKTTTLRMLLGLAAPTRGRALVFGQPYAALAQPALRIGAVLEATDFHPGRSGRDHLRMLGRQSACPTRASRRCCGWSSSSSSGRRVKGYSLGMRQRLGLAAALLGDPELLILDEPANGLDPEGVRWLRDFLRAFAAERADRAHLEPRARRGRADRRSGADHQPRPARRRVLARAADRARRRLGPRTHTRTGEGSPTRCSEAGIETTASNEHALLAHGTTSERVGDIAFAAGVPMHELIAEGSSLEEVFLELTSEPQP